MASSKSDDKLAWSLSALPEPPTADQNTMDDHSALRARTPRPRRHSGALELRVPEMHNIRRWDGAARACHAWDSLGRDPELWFKNGNCFVHLYGKGQSRRGPAFKVPFEALMQAKCHPLVARFLARDGPVLSTRPGQRYFDFVDRMNPNARIELYIPPPPMATREEALRHHLTTRNFFAWVFRRSLVGEHLGTTLISLLNSMSEFRCPGEDNMEGLLSYLDEEGYLELRNQPIHALAILHFAEYFQFKDLYINAFTHCVGMMDQLFAIPEYQVITSVTRKLVRQAKSEMDQRLGQAGVMLRCFLQEDLSEAHMGLTPGARAHLDRFRTFLLGFFTTKLGYYPPGSIESRNLIFERNVYCAMRKDFEALYEYLVDESFTAAGMMPALAQGGICTLQSVHGFDLRNKYTSLQYPLPLLPEISPSTTSRRMSWLGKADKLRPDQRLVTHSALLKATNKNKPGVSRNPLVVAYRHFEEDSIFSPLKADRHDKLSQVDARKIRWILIYTTYQVLRDCAGAPPECREAAEVQYNIAVNTANLPPWKESKDPLAIVQKASDIRRSRRVTISAPITPTPSSPVFSPEIKPDIDYLALSQRDDSSTSLSGPPAIPPRGHSLKNKSFRRSLNIFAPSQSIVLDSSGPRNRSSSYHEILVQGYGNGTNDVHVDGDDAESESDQASITYMDSFMPNPLLERVAELELQPQPLTLRSPSTSSTSSANSTAKSSTSGFSEAASAVSSASSAPSLKPQPSTWTKASGVHPQDAKGRRTAVQRASPPTVPRRSSRRKLLSTLHPIPLRIKKVHDAAAADASDDSSGWMDVDMVTSPVLEEDDEEDDRTKLAKAPNVWDQFACVGGLKEVGSTASMPELAAQ